MISGFSSSSSSSSSSSFRPRVFIRMVMYSRSAENEYARHVFSCSFLSFSSFFPI